MSLPNTLAGVCQKPGWTFFTNLLCQDGTTCRTSGAPHRPIRQQTWHSAHAVRCSLETHNRAALSCTSNSTPPSQGTVSPPLD